MKQTRLWMIAVIFTFCCGTTVFTSCNKNDNPVVPTPTPTPTPLQREFFPNWNTCEALDVLQEYVEDVTYPRSANFITAEDRIATFDMDGTLVGELYPTYFEYNLLEYRGFDGMTYGESFYRPMLDVFNYLKANGFTFYVVLNRFICRSLVEVIGIDPNRVN